MKTGIIGGTFDPVHNGHLMLAENAYRQFGLDKVLFMPANVPYFKTRKRRVTPPELRLRMTELAVRGIPYFEASDYELKIPGKTYTANTLTELKKQHPEDELYFIAGADLLYQIEYWYKPELIFAAAVILCARRQYEAAGSGERDFDSEISYLREKFKGVNADIRSIQGSIPDISSSEIRDMVLAGKESGLPVPPAVEEFIKEKKLYTDVF